ncbi:chitin synthase-domain-containing protein [Catenaria anguillulae PL171]|uniref:chitin synthase n=1 Tax=Catenaria anguillulae PL171 TaxID=765915 RepID=A0A1Y2HAT1_9FUNG|nr:chitin synthase-domain-containing protein [Catenaria anguillulae PL171]
MGGNLMVFNGRVLDLSPYFKSNSRFLGEELHAELLSLLGKDASYALSRNTQLANSAACLQALYTVGFVDTDSPGCIASQIILSLSLILILGVVLTRFFLAVAFDWVLSWRLGKLQVSRAAFAQLHRPGRKRLTAFLGKDKHGTPSQSDFTLPDATPIPDELRPYYTVVLVTCYSESEAELTKTLDSVAATEFPDEQKLLFVVADGIITGKGQSKSTPETVLGLMDEILRHNKARVHVGWYKCGEHRTPMVVVVKSGNDDEQGKPKPGNRGKRDGQIILMDFFSKIMLGERLCPLQFDLFYKIFGLTGVHPLKYEIVLMVDADTNVFLPDSLPRMVACMAQDSSIMGLCGETRIENKSQSWVTRIQVFEYYISHHLGKSFESIFGGVTCLPGCFCMYRLKVQRPDKLWVPILCSPVIITAYSENVVDTLHKKNLLSLGEDRYLSTLMLRNFPKRKMMFVPRALCRTIVPHTLNMLLSQRRRWINSTIHNLLELVLVRQLCGTFCFSMQFVVMMELFGTVSLPVAIIMTFYLIFQTILGNVQLIPLVMLVCILGLPAVLIMLTTRKFVYIYWMIIFLSSLPVWNFLLPVYAFWHFDDFSWGATRKVDGEHAQGDHSKREGEFDATKIPFLHVEDWTRMINGLPPVAEPLASAAVKPSDLPVTLYPAPDTTESGRNQGLGAAGLDMDRASVIGSAIGQRSSKLRRKTNSATTRGPQL